MSDKIYIASKTKHAAKWRALRDGGANIISTWIDESEPGQTLSFTDLWRRCVKEASAADVLIFYAEEGEQFVGAFVEIGAALANDKMVRVVGPCAVNWSWRHHALVERWGSVGAVITGESSD